MGWYRNTWRGYAPLPELINAVKDHLVMPTPISTRNVGLNNTSNSIYTEKPSAIGEMVSSNPSVVAQLARLLEVPIYGTLYLGAELNLKFSKKINVSIHLSLAKVFKNGEQHIELLSRTSVDRLPDSPPGRPWLEEDISLSRIHNYNDNDHGTSGSSRNNPKIYVTHFGYPEVTDFVEAIIPKENGRPISIINLILNGSFATDGFRSLRATPDLKHWGITAVFNKTRSYAGEPYCGLYHAGMLLPFNNVGERAVDNAFNQGRVGKLLQYCGVMTGLRLSSEQKLQIEQGILPKSVEAGATRAILLSRHER